VSPRRHGPVEGARIETVTRVRFDGNALIQPGTKGTFKGHTKDGRAIVRFDGMHRDLFFSRLPYRLAEEAA
jgi:hypothetical protein